MMLKNILLSTFLIVTFLSTHSELYGQSTYKLAEQDSLALVAFYWATDGPNWTSNQEGFGFDDLTSEWQVTYNGKFNNWFDGPVKDWFGVTVEKLPIPNSADSIDRVTWLWPVIGRRTDGQNQLSGYVPREVGLLTALKQFRVNGNDGFTGEIIPDELYHKSLQHFDTESAWFGAGISDAFRNCTDIRKINIRYNLYDYMPNLDFLGEQGARNLEGTQWFYNSRFSYFYMERIVDFFYSISDTPMEFGIEARDMFEVGDEIEIVAPLGSSLEMVCNDAGMKEEFITYQWFKDGLSKFGKSKKNYTIGSVSASDYGHYTTRITNDYVKNYDGNGNYGEVFTKGIHVVESPASPVVTKAVVENNGQIVDLFFSKNMTGAEGLSSLKITVGDQELPIASSEVIGRLNRQIRIKLDTPIQEGDMVLLSYAGDIIKDKNGGLLESFTDLEIENRTRIAPEIVGASTTLDGNGVVLTFNYYIDQNSLDDALFTIEGENEYSIASVNLQNGEVNPQISKSVLISLNEAIVDTAEVITVGYLSGSVHGLYSGTVQPFEDVIAENIVTVDRAQVTLYFEDGSEDLANVVIDGSWRLDPVSMYDDGTNGDLTADDHIWTLETFLPEDTYTWDALSRKTETTIDTIQSTDSLGNTVLTLVPSQQDIDSLLSGNFLLEFTLTEREVAGDTVFGIFNRDVIFNLQVNATDEEIYLMGINDDWNEGILMTKISDGMYTHTVPSKSAGDFLNYNYRRGSTFENQTPETRSYSVINGYNEVNDQFGVFTSVENSALSQITFSPNPSLDGIIYIDNLENTEEIRVYNNLGVLIHSLPVQGENNLILDLTNSLPGIYYINAIGRHEKNVQETFKILTY